MNSIKKNIPNFLTCCNLLCGCAGILIINTNQNSFLNTSFFAAYLVGAAALFDFLDGFVARLLKVHSEIGKQLDSLADMVTFGVLPGMIAMYLLEKAMNQNEIIAIFGLLITVFSAIRLAKFNIDTRQSDSFIGVPTPANTILWSSFLLIDEFSSKHNDHVSVWMTNMVHDPFALLFLVLLTSYLLIAELPLFALKFKNFSWVDNKVRYLFLILSIIFLIAFRFNGIPFTILLYILLSVAFKQKPKNV